MLSPSSVLVHKNRPDVLYLRQNSFPVLSIMLCKVFEDPFNCKVNGLVLDELKSTRIRSLLHTGSSLIWHFVPRSSTTGTVTELFLSRIS